MTHEQIIKIVFNNIPPFYTNKFGWLFMTRNFTLNVKFVNRTFKSVMNQNIPTIQHVL